MGRQPEWECPARDPHVDLRFRTGYALVSWSRGKVRVTGRVEAFDNEDRDGVAEPDGEHGWAATGDADTDARRAMLELRLAF